MLRLLIILTLGTALSACDLFEKGKEDKSITTLEGTDPDGIHFTYVSLSGYQAIRLNSQSWEHVNNEINLKNLSEYDILAITKLCEANEDRSAIGLYRELNVKDLTLLINDDDKYMDYCYGSNQPPSSEKIAITIKSQQESEGTEILGAYLNGDYASGFDATSGIYQVNKDNLPRTNSIKAIGYNEQNETAYIYKDNQFNFQDGDTLTIDFLSENSQESIVAVTDKMDYEYTRYFCDNYSWPCTKLSFITNKLIKIEYPETLKVEGGTYTEHWNNRFLIDGETYKLSYRSSSNDNPLEHNPLEIIQPEIQKVQFDTTRGLKLQAPLLSGFEDSEWRSFTVHKYESFEIWSDYIDTESLLEDYQSATDGVTNNCGPVPYEIPQSTEIVLNGTIGDLSCDTEIPSVQNIAVLELDLSELPNVPLLFDIPPNEMKSAEQHLDIYCCDVSNDKNHGVGLVVPIPIDYFQNH